MPQDKIKWVLTKPSRFSYPACSLFLHSRAHAPNVDAGGIMLSLLIRIRSSNNLQWEVGQAISEEPSSCHRLHKLTHMLSVTLYTIYLRRIAHEQVVNMPRFPIVRCLILPAQPAAELSNHNQDLTSFSLWLSGLVYLQTEEIVEFMRPSLCQCYNAHGPCKHQPIASWLHRRNTM
jgi:hypothetical protein